MAEVTPVNHTFFLEDVKAGAGVSEAFAKKLAESYAYIIANAGDYVGKYEFNDLTEEEFASIKKYDHTLDEPLKKWVQVKGQSIVGSAFHLLKGASRATLPNAVANGAFPRQARTEADLMRYANGEVIAHSHNVPMYGGTGSTSLKLTSGMISFTSSGNHPTSSTGASENTPNWWGVNIFLKIND